jgi:hypothetical protein
MPLIRKRWAVVLLVMLVEGTSQRAFFNEAGGTVTAANATRTSEPYRENLVATVGQWPMRNRHCTWPAAVVIFAGGYLGKSGELSLITHTANFGQTWVSSWHYFTVTLILSSTTNFAGGFGFCSAPN